MVTWSSFVEAAHDDVLLIALAQLEANSVLSLAAASASTSARLASAGDHFGSAAQRFAAAHLGDALAADAVQAAARLAAVAAEADAEQPDDASPESPKRPATRSDEHPGLSEKAGAERAPGASRSEACYAGPLAVLRALVAATPAAEALRFALSLAKRPECDTEGAVQDACKFLEAFFRSEVRRLVTHGRWGAGVVTAATADAALTALLLAGEGGLNVVQAAARAVRESECELDTMLDEGLTNPKHFHNVYEGVARRRSAAEFLRKRLSGGASGAHKELDSAVSELDDTIAGYAKEGYELACPRLANGAQARALPHAHWWVFLGRGHAQGWAVLPGAGGLMA